MARIIALVFFFSCCTITLAYLMSSFVPGTEKVMQRRNPGEKKKAVESILTWRYFRSLSWFLQYIALLDDFPLFSPSLAIPGSHADLATSHTRVVPTGILRENTLVDICNTYAYLLVSGIEITAADKM